LWFARFEAVREANIERDKKERRDAERERLLHQRK